MRRPVIGLSSYGEHARYWIIEHEVVLLPRPYVDVVTAARDESMSARPAAMRGHRCGDLPNDHPRRAVSSSRPSPTWNG